MTYALESIDLAAYADTPLALEAGLADGSEFWMSCAVAGLQFYSYGTHDEFVGEVIPALGDSLAIMRRPENSADANACEVWWRNRFHLGHLPREVAAALAPRIDRGEGVRANVLDGGDGERWSMRALLVGRAAEDLHQQRLEAVDREREWRERDELRQAIESVWPSPRFVPGGRWNDRTDVPAPSAQQRRGAELFESDRRLARHERRAAAVFAFHLLPPDRPVLPPEIADAVPDEALRGRTFSWWDQVPGWLKTKTQWREHGFKPGKGVRPFAHIEYGSGRRWRRHDLYAVNATVPIAAVSPTVVAAAAERAFRSRHSA